MLPSPELQDILYKPAPLTCVEARQVILDNSSHAGHVLDLVILWRLCSRDHEVTPQQAAQLIGPNHTQPVCVFVCVCVCVYVCVCVFHACPSYSVLPHCMCRGFQFAFALEGTQKLKKWTHARTKT